MENGEGPAQKAPETDEEEAKKLVEELYQFNRTYFETHHFDDAEKKEEDLQQKMKDTLQRLASKEAALSPPTYQYLRGKALNVLGTHSKEAEHLLTQAVKHNPSLVDGWNSLGESYWKSGNVTQAHHCFTGALSHEVNKESLRNLSMVLRQLGKDVAEKRKNMKESLEKAKQAVSLDVKDGISWSNAYLAMFFTVEQDHKFLQQAGSAYAQSEKDAVAANNPDLNFNMATLRLYEESYERTLYHLERASKLDPGWPTPCRKLKSLKGFLQEFSRQVSTCGKLKPKRLAGLKETLSQSIEKKGQRVVTIRELREKGEVGKDTWLLGAVASCVTNEDKVPLASVLIDVNGDSIGCTMYNLLDTFQFNVGDILSLPNPKLVHVSIPDLEVEYDNVRCTQPQEVLCNGKTISTDKLSVSIAQVTAFS